MFPWKTEEAVDVAWKVTSGGKNSAHESFFDQFLLLISGLSYNCTKTNKCRYCYSVSIQMQYNSGYCLIMILFLGIGFFYLSSKRWMKESQKIGIGIHTQQSLVIVFFCERIIVRNCKFYIYTLFLDVRLFWYLLR